MPNGILEMKQRCWKDRSRLERMLNIILIIFVFVLIVLIIILIVPKGGRNSNICETTTCLIEASNVLERIDTTVDPCHDFYNFSCGTFLRNAHGDDELEFKTKLENQKERELNNLYSENIHPDDHKVVKVTKALYNACMNERNSDTSRVDAIKKALRTAGGWPILEDDWDGPNFEWLDAIYKLRELGYDYSMLLKTSLETKNSTNYIFKVAPPDPGWEDDVTEKFLTVASFFGAQHNNETLSQAVDVNRFYNNLRLYYRYQPEEEISIDQLQKNITTLDWIQFVTRMAGFEGAVSKDSIILIDSVDKTQRWLDLISRTNNRPLANFIMWKAAEDAMEHLITNVHTSMFKHTSIERKEFCYEQLKKSFIINPIETIWMRRYLSPEKRQKINSMVLDVRDRLVKDLEKIDWVNSDDQKKMVSKIKEMQIIIGMPGNYFSDDLLNAMDIDLVYSENGGFMELVGQTKRNKETIQYRRIKGSKEDNLILKMFEWRHLYFGIGSFLAEDNVFFASGIFTRDDLFNENRPNYINYGIGISLFSIMVEYIDQSSWTDQTRKNFEEKIRCVDRSLKKLDLTTVEIKLMLRFSDIQRIAYEAYRGFTKMNGEEQKLIGLDYTPNQLFWIFNMFPYCQPVNNYSGKFLEILRNGSVFAKTSSAARSLIPQFLEDFSCSETSRMHSKEICRMF